MRELFSHVVNPANEQLHIEVLDEPGSGGANHLYRITGFDSASNASDPWAKLHGHAATQSHVLFQNGPIQEAGVNGVTHEALLAILIDRLEGFQRGTYANTYNGEALANLKNAQHALHARTRERQDRGVEGTHQA